MNNNQQGGQGRAGGREGEAEQQPSTHPMLASHCLQGGTWVLIGHITSQHETTGEVQGRVA